MAKIDFCGYLWKTSIFSDKIFTDRVFRDLGHVCQGPMPINSKITKIG